MCLFRKGSIYESPAKPSWRAGDWAQGLPHAERVWYHYTNCPLQVEAPLGGSKEVSGCLSWLAGRVFLPVLLLWCVLCLFLFGPSWWCLGLWRLLEPAGTCPERAGKPVPLHHHSIPLHQLPPCQRGRRCNYEGEDVFMKASALTKMYLWMRRCIYEGVSADEDVFMNAKMYSWRCQRWRRCIYEGEDVFMKASALTKMYLWRQRCIYVSALTKMYLWMRRCIHEGVSADEDVFMKAKMYLWRCQRWRRCIYECEGVFMKVSALMKMYLWMRRCIHEGVSADEDVFMKAKMYSWRRQRWRRCIYEGEDVYMKVSALTKMYLWRRRCIYEGVSADEDVFMKAKMYLWRWLERTCWQRCIYEGEDVSMKVVTADENVFMKAKMYLLRWGARVSADMSALGALTYQLWFCWIYLYFIGFQIWINAINKKYVWKK